MQTFSIKKNTILNGSLLTSFRSEFKKSGNPDIFKVTSKRSFMKKSGNPDMFKRSGNPDMFKRSGFPDMFKRSGFPDMFKPPHDCGACGGGGCSRCS